jgi:DNA recombination protein RmuC
MLIILLSIALGLIIITLFSSFMVWRQNDKGREQLIRIEARWTDLNTHLNSFNESRLHDQRNHAELKAQLQHELNQYRQHFDQHQLQTLKLLQDSVQQGMNVIGGRVDKLTEATELKLKEISGQVEKRLSDGFAQTTATFTDVIKRLALIDEAQKRITELSTNVVSLQEILSDKRSRGVFGEVQLSALISNVLPETHYALQHSFSNGRRADCVLFLPAPTGTIAIDSKFPLESYRRLSDNNLTDSERKAGETQFRLDIRKHIQDVASKYIIANETADGAMLFIPAEAVFAEIHAHYYELVEEAHRQRVWLVSPTTMMAILTTARAVVKDAATREQVHIIQKYLAELAKDFDRFQIRMTNLAKHIDQAHGDIQDVKISADKITTRFAKIEKVELELPVEINL